MTGRNLDNLTDAIDDPNAATLFDDNPDVAEGQPGTTAADQADKGAAAGAAEAGADGKGGDAAAGKGDDKAGGDAAAGAAAAAGAGEGGDAAAAAGTVDAGAGGKDKANNMVPQWRLDEMAAERRQMAQRVEQLEAAERQRQDAAARATAQGFEQRYEDNQRRYDEGEIDLAEFNRENRKIDREERAHEREQDRIRLQAETATQQRLMSWQERSDAWKEANAEFLANPIRRRAMDDELKRLDIAEPNLPHDELLKRAEEAVFEAYNFTRVDAGAGGGKGKTPQQQTEEQRRQAQATAVAQHAALPARPDGGSGTRGTDGKVAFDENTSRDEWDKMTEAQQNEALGISQPS